MVDISIVKSYYDNNVLGKIRGFVEGNMRVELAWDEINKWVLSPPSNILEIGCGIGDLTWRMSKQYPESKVTGFDVSEKSIDIAQKLFQNNNLIFHVADDINILNVNDEKFDLIYLVDVYEHIPVGSRENLFNFFAQRLSEKGIIFLSCPTISHQNWLKENKPDGLQPIDENVSISDIIEISMAIDRKILLFKEVSVWHSGDYFHAVLGEWKTRTPPKVTIKKKTLKDRILRIKKQISNIRISQHYTDFEKKIMLVKDKIGLYYNDYMK
jgi:SAM-dependent methyltransferase